MQGLPSQVPEKLDALNRGESRVFHVLCGRLKPPSLTATHAFFRKL